MLMPLPNVVSLSLKAVAITCRARAGADSPSTVSQPAQRPDGRGAQQPAARRRSRLAARGTWHDAGTLRPGRARRRGHRLWAHTCMSAGDTCAPELACTVQLGSKMTWKAGAAAETRGRRRGKGAREGGGG